MKFLKSYRGAMIVMVVVIVLCVLLGSHRSLTAEREKVETLFYDGADGSGYSVYTDLADCVDISANLLSVAGRYLDESQLEQLMGSRDELAASIDPDSRYYSIGNAYQGYQRLTAEAETVITALEVCDLSEKDAEYVRGFRTDLAARADTISRDPYNEKAEEFNSDVLGAFPANLLRRITSVDEVQVFG